MAWYLSNQRQERECNFGERNPKNPSSWAPKNELRAPQEKTRSFQGENLEISLSILGSQTEHMQDLIAAKDQEKVEEGFKQLQYLCFNPPEASWPEIVR